MDLKMKLTSLLISLGLVLFLNHAIYAQGEPFPKLLAGAAGNFNHENRETLTAKTSSVHLLPVFLSSSFSGDTLNTETKSDLKTKQFYLQRSKNQKTTAWILLGGGTFMVIGGTIVLIGDAMAIIISIGKEGSGNLIGIASAIIYTGIIADLVSIPFFISASHNKRLAASLSFDNQRIYSSPNNSFSSNVHPSLTLKIRF